MDRPDVPVGVRPFVDNGLHMVELDYLPRQQGLIVDPTQKR